MEQLDAILNIIFLPLYIFVVMTLHELGHYFAARFFNISVDSFSLGYGDMLWNRTDRRGTNWSVRLFPICGHVHLSAKPEQARGTLFYDAPVWQRIVVILSGPLTNFVTAFLILFMFFGFFGQPSKPPVIAAVQPGSPAWEAGLRTGDRIVEVEGQAVERYHDVWEHYYEHPGVTLDMKFQRGDRLIATEITPERYEYTTDDGIDRSHGRMGILIGWVFLSYNALEAIDGIPVPDENEELIRLMLLERLGQKVLFEVQSVDGETIEYETILDPDLNSYLSDPEHEKSGAFYIGPVEHNFYLPRDVTHSLLAAGEQMGMLVEAVAKVPFQLFPMDREMLSPWALVMRDDMYAVRKLYEFCYRVALVSVVIALLNMIPFPGLDGSILLLQAVEGAMGKDNPRGRQVYKYTLLILLFTLYSGIMLANIHDFPRYVHNMMEQDP